ncbi:MAG: hypothetical protein ACAH11_12820 [Sphingomonas sp.]
MSPFEFTFSLFGLLLGFSLVEVLGGLVRTVKLRGTVRIGWITPLLGLFVMVDLTSFWNVAWSVRDAMPASFSVLLFGLLICGVYYFSASMVFPEKPEEWPDFDLWAERHKRQVMSGILVANVLATIAVLAPQPEKWTLYVIVTNCWLLGFMALAAVARPKWVTGLTLAAMLLFYFYSAGVDLARQLHG